VSDAALQRLRDWGAKTAVVLGSGLDSLAERIRADQRIAFREFADLPQPKVEGHAGEFALVCFDGTPVIFARGRIHLYEGYSASEVAACVRLLAASGVRRLVLTNAAGSANPEFAPGTWMMINDHLNLTGTTPLLGAPAFVDMTNTYSAEWRMHFRRAANDAHVTLHEGVYAGVLGPNYETPAEVRMLRKMGADAIGMSTVVEAIAARAAGLEIVGFSCLTNWAAGISGDPLSHAEVLQTGRAAAAQFARLLETALSSG
jgi:purine-nucleoside phosphorylase